MKDWFKSSFSGGNDDNCVEVSHGVEITSVRHSKHPDGPVLEYTAGEWSAFLDGVRAGEFDK